MNFAVRAVPMEIAATLASILDDVPKPKKMPEKAMNRPLFRFYPLARKALRVIAAYCVRFT